MLVINPDECIDCALCEPECPIDAIYSEDEVPEDQLEYIELNAELCMSGQILLNKKIHYQILRNGKLSKVSSK